MGKQTKQTNTFKVCDGSTEHVINEYTIFIDSFAGGIHRQVEAGRHYKDEHGNDVEHRDHKEFRVPGSQTWLRRCEE